MKRNAIKKKVIYRLISSDELRYRGKKVEEDDQPHAMLG